MLTQSEIERAQYEDRRKAMMDHNSFMRGMEREACEARQQGFKVGFKEGIERGKKLSEIAYVQMYERLLGRAESPEARLIALPQEQLGRIAKQLLEELLAAKSS